jgi:hypothetical protein
MAALLLCMPIHRNLDFIVFAFALKIINLKKLFDLGRLVKLQTPKPQLYKFVLCSDSVWSSAFYAAFAG